jgi:hypothetical protein
MLDHEGSGRHHPVLAQPNHGKMRARITWLSMGKVIPKFIPMKVTWLVLSHNVMKNLRGNLTFIHHMLPGKKTSQAQMTITSCLHIQYCTESLSQNLYANFDMG